VAAGFAAGCKHAPAIPEPQQSAARAAAQKTMNDAQNELSLIPPPVKTRYTAVKSLAEWQNPYLTVEASNVTLHVLTPDSNPSSLGEGSMLRPVNARREEMVVRMSDLAEALAAVPEGAWPYGRVIAVEEQSGAPANERPAIRRNVEATLKMMNDLGLVADEWNEQNSGPF
jgi:hypothetical protein